MWIKMILIWFHVSSCDLMWFSMIQFDLTWIIHIETYDGMIDLKGFNNGLTLQHMPWESV